MKTVSDVVSYSLAQLVQLVQPTWRFLASTRQCRNCNTVTGYRCEMQASRRV